MRALGRAVRLDLEGEEGAHEAGVDAHDRAAAQHARVAAGGRPCACVTLGPSRPGGGGSASLVVRLATEGAFPKTNMVTTRSGWRLPFKTRGPLFAYEYDSYDFDTNKAKRRGLRDEGYRTKAAPNVTFESLRVGGGL